MAINSCTVNTYSVNGLNCSRRSVIIQDLINKLTVRPETGGQQHVNPVKQSDFKKTDINVFRREREEQIVYDFEQPYITVTVTFNGKQFVQTIDKTPLDDIILVNVKGLEFSLPESILVNISDIKVQRPTK